MNAYSLMINFFMIMASLQINPVDSNLVVTPEFETFDMVRFERIRFRPNSFDGMEILDNGTTIIMKKVNAGSSYAEIPRDSYFFLNKAYYFNGNIREKGLFFIYDGFRKGMWYYFDEQGNLTDSIDHDKPFRFTFEQVLAFARKEGLVFMKTPVDWDYYSPWRPKIKREYNPISGECWWEIGWYKGIPPGAIERIRLDGVTGKEISRTYLTFNPG